MTNFLHFLRHRPAENILLFLILMFGVVLFGLVLTMVAPGLSGNDFPSGVAGRELTVQTRDNDWRALYSSPNASPVVRVGRVGDLPITLELPDLVKLKTQAPAVQAAYLNDSIYLGDFQKNLQVQSITDEYLPALKGKLIQGALMDDTDYRDRRSVTVLTSYGARFLFPDKAAVGQSVEGYRVIGIIDIPKGERQGFRSVDQTEFGALGFVPYGSQSSPDGQTRYQRPISVLRFLPFAGRDAEAISQLSATLQRRWQDRVTLSSSIQRNVSYREIARRGALVLTLMGLGGLMVASLSVLTMMLTRVLARQRQLGIAAALGASRAQLRRQFLLEILLISTLSNLAGTGVTVWLLWWLNQGAGDSTIQVLTLNPLMLLSAAVSATLLSVLFSLLPAVQASRVRPAEALRV